MKAATVIVVVSFLAGAMFPAAGLALGLEAAVGVWHQETRGDLSVKELSPSDRLSLEDDLRFGKQTRVMGRVKIDTLPLVPNIYLMATPMSFDGTGITDTFKFGDVVFNPNLPVNSKLQLDHYDVGIYYGIPLLKTVTAGVLNVDAGILVRFVDFKAEMVQPASGLQASTELLIPMPLGFAAFQLRPVSWLAVEGEVRGTAYDGNYYLDLIGRGKIMPFRPLFVAGGYRYEALKIDQRDIRVEGSFGGPFVEVGVEF